MEKEERNLSTNEPFFNEKNNEETIVFFDQKNVNIPKDEVVQNIDENQGKRGVKESNFYMINISPSYVEQRHILKRIDRFLDEKESNEKLKWSDEQKWKTRDLMMRDFMTSYVREVMKAYASNFDREINGNKISEKYLMYYGRVETKRSYSLKDKHVIRNKELFKKIDKTKDKNQKEQLQKMLHKDYFTDEIIVEGDEKGGPNYHMHSPLLASYGLTHSYNLFWYSLNFISFDGLYFIVYYLFLYSVIINSSHILVARRHDRRD